MGSRRGAPSSPSAHAHPQGCCPKPAAHGNTFTRSPAQVCGLPASAAGGAAPPATVRLSPGRAVLGQPVRGRVCSQKFEVPSFSSASTGYELLQRTPLGLEEYIVGPRLRWERRRSAKGDAGRPDDVLTARRRPHGRRARRPGSGATSSRGERVLSSRALRIHRAGRRRSSASTRPADGHCPPRRAAPRCARGRGEDAPPARAPSTSLSRTRRRRAAGEGSLDAPRRLRPAALPRGHHERPRGLLL